jgi:BASS family bile acid:Na+ symporter
MLLIGVIPVILGVAFNETFPKSSKMLQLPLKYVNTLLLAIVFGIKFFASIANGGSGITSAIVISLLPASLIIHLVTMFGSYFISRGFKLPNIKATTIGIEVGLQNTTLALLITATLIGSDEMSQPALVIAIFSFFTTLGFAFLIRNRNNHEKVGT